jgi:ferredoxin-type protein NapH
MQAPASDSTEVVEITRFPVPERYEPKRRTILRATGKRRHRYRLLRGFTQTITIAILLVVPALAIARVDLLLGDHLAWRTRGAPLLDALVAVGVSIFSFYLLTFLVNLVAGRMFCGWGCPVGQLNRLADTFVAQNKLRGRLLWGGIFLGFAMALAGAVGLWWASPAAFVSAPAVAGIAWGGVVALGASAVLFARVIGWSFCKKVCPIGLYYSVVQQKRPIGIQFDASKCQDEGACVRACPVGLDARDLVQLQYDIGGFAIDGLAQNNHCLRCGACVEACEIVTSKQPEPALVFGRASLPIVSDTPAASTVQPVFVPPEPEPEPMVPAQMTAEEAGPSEPLPKWAFGAMGAVALAIVGGAVFFAIDREAKSPTTTTAPPPTEVPKTPKATDAPVAYGAIHGVVKDAQGAPIAGVLVGIDDAPRGKKKTWSVVVEDARYARAVYVVAAKDRIVPENRDETLHTFHISGDDQTFKNVPLPASAEGKSFAVPRPGEYRIFCDTHPEERAKLIVRTSGPVERTDDNGEFEIGRAPEGAAKVTLFYEDGRRTEHEVHVTASETTNFLPTGEE